ncbi:MULTISPECIES: AAA family ATPase [Flectobacillus]|jgi:MoxR-like ATPase|uniref:AAA family ATPase n=3 Tax=Flectobacillus TaxID=101 RepID=A0ABT6Z7X9_9BACT|nr:MULTISPECIES: AAA family ATPase [Flectobacillus]NBA74756.1 AAA domain-containing protein [Emticicia sp. ODNR4P]MDI9860489.1 AAA family ATPase [Flectobacillus roseus]MDI9865402.1 AAA family ATPase [Flectobacillus longus]MDI9876729.1 AAA family ATPase [Flectobacillus rivi]MDI9881726.1 AAA family ATPase [Flectobacillus longus]
MNSRAKIKQVFDEMGKIVVGHERLTNRLLIGLFTGGHVLLEGVPGLAKTLTINTLAKILDLNFHRIQFTPDLLPADLIGTMIYNRKLDDFEVRKGPIFANIILADEINRAPAKVQSALLEAMQEKQVTIGDESYILDKPFLVLATQNPVEQEGTFPLPEAQVDRFMLKVFMGYLSKEQELEVMQKMSNMDFNYKPKVILTKEDISNIRQEINKITISETLERYIIELIFATRKPGDYGLRDEARYVQFGASPRATINLNLAAKVLAYLDERDYVLPEDIKEIAPDVLNHRIMLNYEAEADGITTMQVIDTILRRVAIGR